MSRLLFVSGSQRRDSFNTRLLEWLARRVDGRYEVDLLEPRQVALPLFDQDLETDADVADRVAQVHARFERCAGFVVASPEYNGQPTPYLKNVIDWVSRLAHIDRRYTNPFHARPLLLCSASTGWSGGAVGLAHARALFGYVGSIVVGDAICVPYADRAWTDDGYDFDPCFDMQADAALDSLIRVASVSAGERIETAVCA